MNETGESPADVRVGLLHIQLDDVQWNSLAKSQPEKFFKISRRRWLGPASTVATLLSGTSLEAHGVETWLVPADGAINDSSSGLGEENFRWRRSTEFNRPILWHRLAAQGIESVVVGSRFASSGVEGVHEVDQQVLQQSANLRNVSVPQASFEALLEARSRWEQAAFHLLSLNLATKASNSEDGQSVRADQGDRDEGGDILQSISSTILRFQETMSLDHLLVLYSTRVVEWLTYHGDRELGLNSKLVKPGAVVSTVLDLFGLPKMADVSSRSILEAETSSETDQPEGEITWELPPDDEDRAPDLSAVVAAAMQGEGGRVTQGLAQEVARLAWEKSYASSTTAELVTLARNLVAIDESPRNLYRLCASISMQNNSEEFLVARARLQTLYPDSTQNRMVDLLPIAGKSTDERIEILDQNPYETFHEPHLRGLWARAAMNSGRIDEGLVLLWRRIQGEWSNHQEQLVFAVRSIERNQEMDLPRARYALTRIIPMISSPERRSKIVRMLAETYVKTDDPKTAIAILEGFLSKFPGEMGATSMLNALRRQAGD
jgi:hypothetical protein